MRFKANWLERLRDPAVAIAHFRQVALLNDRVLLITVLRYIMEANRASAVQLTKFRTSPNALRQPGRWDEYSIGLPCNTTSLPVDYVLIGVLLVPPQVGNIVCVLRSIRNDVEIPGVFESTEVVAVKGQEFTTLNSVYAIKKIKPAALKL